ncbi:hypothetical protein N431DRAFT_465012 [Stipitochalara longipes BDJ]|nr:hypothetical protein N431DRAFT_465012 [Stipitochalara longipes BDJ]
MAAPSDTKRRRRTRLTMPKKKWKVDFVDSLQGQVTAPEEGVHSLVWAQTIAPQAQGLFKLPVEVRNMIYAYLIRRTTIAPRKSRKGKFVNGLEEYEEIDTCTTLSRVCKQLFADVTSSGLLYSTNHFLFNTPFSMFQYITSIHSYRNFRNISLRIPLSHKPSNSNVLSMLASLPMLKNLIIKFHVPTHLCTVTDPGSWRGFRSYEVKKEVLEQLEKANWGMLGNQLLSFGLDFTVSPKTPPLDTRWSFYGIKTWLDTEDLNIKELERKIKEVVLRK